MVLWTVQNQRTVQNLKSTQVFYDRNWENQHCSQLTAWDHWIYIIKQINSLPIHKLLQAMCFPAGDEIKIILKGSKV